MNMVDVERYTSDVDRLANELRRIPSCKLINDMLRQPHLLIAGATGSGKSVLINGIVKTIIRTSPNDKLVLIDPKKVELWEYHRDRHTLAYADETAAIVATLRNCIQTMELRYFAMKQTGAKEAPFSHIYVIIDEYADLMITAKKEVQPLIIRLSQLGRAARIHLIMATQRPTRDIITGAIKVNMDSRVALRCPTAQDSRNIINMNGAEKLPRYGKGYYLTPETMHPVLVDIPMID